MIFAHCTFQNRKVFQDKDKGIIISGNSLALQVRVHETNVTIYDGNDSENSTRKWRRLFLHRYQYYRKEPEPKPAFGCKMWVNEFSVEIIYISAQHFKCNFHVPVILVASEWIASPY